MGNEVSFTADDVNGAIATVYGAVGGAMYSFGVKGLGYSVGAMGVTESVEIIEAYKSGIPGEVQIQSAGWLGGLVGAANGTALGAKILGTVSGSWIGALVGGAVGGYFGAKYGEVALEKIAKHVYEGGLSGHPNSFPDAYENVPLEELTWSQILHGIDLGTVDFGTRCIEAKTLVLRESGERGSIDNIVIGDVVLSFHSFAENGRGALFPKKVLRTFTNITEEWLRLTWSEIGEAKELVTTPSHQFLAAHGGFREIESLVAGGQGTIVLADGSEAEVSADRIVYSAETAEMFEQAEGYVYPENGNLALKPVYKKGCKTYNFEVEDFHTYVAGGVRVHNDSYNNGTGFEYPGWEQLDGQATVELSNGGLMPLNGNLVIGYRFGQAETYRNTPTAIAESVAFGMGAAGASGTDIAFASWREQTLHRQTAKQKDAGLLPEPITDPHEFSKIEAAIKHARNKGESVAAASGADQNSGQDPEGARVDTSQSRTTGQGTGGLGDYDNNGVVSAKEFRRAEQEDLYDTKKTKKSGGESDTSTKPVLLDLDGDGLEVMALDRSTVFLDTGGDGFLHRTAWAGEGDGVLYFDPDGRNEITEKRQFVFTEWDPTATSDLEALASVFDSNGDGVLNLGDTDFGKFKVMVTLADAARRCPKRWPNSASPSST
ncbi:hypothetical protein [Roseibium sp.]|uniref:hypothetical protein n=1 Tax=Roseibium sp. TaxID=1936156 RepID=UPI0032675C9F